MKTQWEKSSQFNSSSSEKKQEYDIHALGESTISTLFGNYDTVFSVVSGILNSQNFLNLKLEDCRNRVLPGTKLNS